MVSVVHCQEYRPLVRDRARAVGVHLAKLLEKASESYYRGLPSPLSDGEFDSLRDKLASLAPDHPFLKTVGAPVAIGVWPKRKHDYLMGSQKKITAKTELDHWKKRMKSRRVSVSHKLDGCTLVLTYENGALKHATSRGDGVEGEVITSNALKMRNVKAKLPVRFTGDLRGEIILPLLDFEKHFKPLGYKNARNSANGKSRDIKDADDLVKYLKVVYFDVIAKAFIKTEELKEKFVIKMGLEYVESKYMDIDGVWDFFEKFDRDSLPHLIDGKVVKINDIAEQNVLGMVSGCPRGQAALKWAGKTTQTVLNSITWQVGLSGRITPVAELEPVDLDGVTISRATLNNLDYIKALDVAIGDVVLIERAGDVIPALIKVLDRSKRQFSGKIPRINLPKKCPSCGSILERDGAYVICPFTECAGAVFGDVEYG